MGPI
jgi:ubiquitin carboxyl-terminal hydrolase 25/28